MIVVNGVITQTVTGKSNLSLSTIFHLNTLDGNNKVFRL